MSVAKFDELSRRYLVPEENIHRLLGDITDSQYTLLELKASMAVAAQSTEERILVDIPQFYESWNLTDHYLKGKEMALIQLLGGTVANPLIATARKHGRERHRQHYPAEYEK